MNKKSDLDLLHTNQRLLIKELSSRGIKVKLIDFELELIEASFKRHKEFLLDRDSSIVPYNVSIITGSKILTKTILKENKISTTKGNVFHSNGIKHALNYVKEIGFPLVVKPDFGSHGENVFLNLENVKEVKKAIKTIISTGCSQFIIEEYFKGNEFRIYIDRNGKFAVLHRDPAFIVGDGENSISNLIKEQNDFRKLRQNALCLINPDKSFLLKNRINITDIPKKGEKIYLRGNSNVATGGLCEDYTNNVHRSVISIAKKALRTFYGLPYAGIDFMTQDIEKLQNKESYRILEVNSIPGIHMHMKPGHGKSRNIAKYIVDMIFPETKENEK